VGSSIPYIPPWIRAWYIVYIIYLTQIFLRRRGNCYFSHNARAHEKRHLRTIPLSLLYIPDFWYPTSRRIRHLVRLAVTMVSGHGRIKAENSFGLVVFVSVSLLISAQAILYIAQHEFTKTPSIAQFIRHIIVSNSTPKAGQGSSTDPLIGLTRACFSKRCWAPLFKFQCALGQGLCNFLGQS